MVLAGDDPQLLSRKGPDYRFPQLKPASGTGGLQGAPTGAFSTGIPYPTGPFSSISTGTPAKSYDGKAAILSPIVPDSQDTTHPDNVIPQDQHTLHYAGNGNTDSSQQGTQAQIQYSFQHPSVPLEHVDSIKNVQCPSDSEISFSFSNSDMFQKAIDSWPKPGSDFVLIDATEGCGKSNQRTFFYVDDYTTDKSDFSVKAKGRMSSGSDPSIVKDFNVKWQQGSSPTSAASVGASVTTAPSVDKRGIGHFLSSELHNGETEVEGLLPTLAKSASTKISVNVAPTATDPSPWGSAKQLGTVDGVTLFCTNCGANGGLSISGSIEASVKSPHLRGGAVDFEASAFNIPMVFGFQAQNAALGHKTFTLPVLQVGLDPFSVPDVFTIGPYFSLGVDFGIALSASGNLEAGVVMTWPDAKAHLDLTNTDSGASSNSGFTPTVQKTWNASDSQIAINGTLGVPISLGVGIIIGDDLFSQNASITDTPQVELDTIFNVQGNNHKRAHARQLAARQDPDPQCTAGVQEIVKFNDLVGINVLNVWKTVLASFTTQVFSTCIETGTPTASHSTTAAGNSSVPAVASTGFRTSPALATAYTTGAPIHPTGTGVPINPRHYHWEKK